MGRRLLSAAEPLTLGGGGCLSSRHNNTENSTGLIAIQTERTDFKEGASVCLRGTLGIMRGIRADTSHSGFIAGVDEEEEMNYSTSISCFMGR